MGLSTLADTVLRSAGNLGDGVSGLVGDTTIRLGVTGLARSGKTVFITSLVANLIERGRMPGLVAAQDGRIVAAYLQPQPDDTVARFAYESHLSDMTGPDPRWPDNTKTISELRLSLRVRPSGLLAGVQGARTVHLDIVDYPGEWLLDLGLLDTSYADWARDSLSRMATQPEARDFISLAEGTDGADKLDEPRAKALAQAFTDALEQAQQAGRAHATPGRFLLPGDLAGSPVLTFAPLPRPETTPRGCLWLEMERRFEAYKSKVVMPFFRDHFARIDRQVVLVDALGAIRRGPEAVAEMRRNLADLLRAFRPGRNGFLSRLLRGRRVEKILFAATKADHLHHTQHGQLTAIVETLVRDARERARFAGAETGAMSLASLRATTEEIRAHDGRDLPCVRGRLQDGRLAALYPGALPEDPNAIFHAKAGDWLSGFDAMDFAPAPLTLRPGDGPPHIRLDRAAQFLFGDRL